MLEGPVLLVDGRKRAFHRDLAGRRRTAFRCFSSKGTACKLRPFRSVQARRALGNKQPKRSERGNGISYLGRTSPLRQVHQELPNARASAGMVLNVNEGWAHRLRGMADMEWHRRELTSRPREAGEVSMGRPCR